MFAVVVANNELEKKESDKHSEKDEKSEQWVMNTVERELEVLLQNVVAEKRVDVVDFGMKGE